ncbi:MAG: RidA family protein [Bacteroidota bacterium]
MNKQFINPEGLFKTNAYTQIVTVEGGKTIYISGQIPFNEKGELVGKDSLGVQINQVFKNIDIALKSVNASFNDVIKVTYYIKNYKPEYLPLVREMRSKYFNKENPPSASLAGVQSLFLKDVLIEVEVVAQTN